MKSKLQRGSCLHVLPTFFTLSAIRSNTGSHFGAPGIVLPPGPSVHVSKRDERQLTAAINPSSIIKYTS